MVYGAGRGLVRRAAGLKVISTLGRRGRSGLGAKDGANNFWHSQRLVAGEDCHYDHW